MIDLRGGQPPLNLFRRKMRYHCVDCKKYFNSEDLVRKYSLDEEDKEWYRSCFCPWCEVLLIKIKVTGVEND